MPPDKDEEKTAADEEENLSDSLKVDDEDKPEDKPADESESEQKGDGEDKDEDKVEVPELSAEQIAALADDPRIVEARKGKEGPTASALDELLKGAVADADQKKESEATAKKDLATREEALKALDEGDPAPLAALAKQAIDNAERQQAVDAAAEEGVDARMATVIKALYGETLEAMKPEEVKALDAMPLVDAIQKLADLKAAGSKAESDTAVSEAEKAARDAATGKSANGDKVGVLPGGSAEEGAEGDDIGALLRKGIGESLDVEE